MSYQALYRKYRPKLFKELVGQNHITAILKNQIQSKCSAHAYLFSGSRGTGKTSTAKIFARAINCLNPQEGEACGLCEACIATEKPHMDIIEIDAASNNGVDDIRALIEQAKFTPIQLTYKVYIIDEVHMLSASASNALLKTLEEPPEHVKLLLATTEPQKLLATVVSRCQRYDFKRLGLADIIDSLKKVLLLVNVEVENGGLYAIARAADGGMRDALSLLDQCLAFCGANISEQDVYQILGSMNTDFFFDLTDALIASNAGKALLMLDEIIRNGRSLTVFMQDLAQHIRALLLCSVCEDCIDILECTPDTMTRYLQQSERITKERILRALSLITKAQNDMKWLGQPRIVIESTLALICRPEDDEGILALEDRISKLEEKLAASEITIKGNIEETMGLDTINNNNENSINISQESHCDFPDENNKKQAEVNKANKDGFIKNDTSEEIMDYKETDESKALWESLRKNLQSKNVSLYVLTTGCIEAVFHNNTLYVTFPKTHGEKVKALLMPDRFSVIKKILGEIKAGVSLVFQLENAQVSDSSSDTQKEELMQVFGDKLLIE